MLSKCHNRDPPKNFSERLDTAANLAVQFNHARGKQVKQTISV